MAENSKIEWCDHTFNPWTGCTKISPGCDHCYAESWAKRSGTVQWGDAPRRRTTEANWRLPLKWNAQAEREGRRFRVFCASLADVFDNTVPSAWRADLMSLIVRTPHLDWLLLTKRIGNAKRMLSDASMHDGLLLTANDEPRVLPNLWLGATIVNREEMLRDGPKLKATPAAVRFWSAEPQVEDLGVIPLELMPDWIIVGGESGHGARQFSVEWAHSIVKQCKAAGVPVHVKQMGARPTWEGMAGPGEHWPTGTVHEPLPRYTDADPAFAVRLRDKKGGDWSEWPEDLRLREFPQP